MSVLFPCTGNSARSIIAEAILAALGAGRFRAFSAGSDPAGKVNPYALALLREKGYETAGLRSKSRDEIERAGAPEMDIIVTVCDGAAAQACPIRPGRPAAAHWGVPDLAAIEGSAGEIRAAFERTYEWLHGAVERLLALPDEALRGSDRRRHLWEAAPRREPSA